MSTTLLMTCLAGCLVAGWLERWLANVWLASWLSCWLSNLMSAGTRGLKGLGCGLGMSLHIPPLRLHTCSPPPAGGPPEGHVQGSHPPLHVSGPDHLPSGTAGDTCIRQTRMHVTRRLMRGPTPPRTTHRFGPDASLHAKHASSTGEYPTAPPRSCLPCPRASSRA